jgi:hypothetical protein
VPLGAYELDRRFRHNPPDHPTAERHAQTRAALHGLPGELDALRPDGPVIVRMINSAAYGRVKRAPRIASRAIGLPGPRQVIGCATCVPHRTVSPGPQRTTTVTVIPLLS